MKFSFQSFAVGFGCAALSLGAVTYANAASDATIKSCANKKTGAMRYISKGKCKKTETSLSWNQMGPQGLSGSSGDKGAQGLAGVKGEAGPTGSAGPSGQNLYLVDADGKTLGQYLGGFQDTYLFSMDNRQWSVTPFRYGFWNFTGGVYYYSDSQCTDRLITINKEDAVPLGLPFIEMNSSGDFGPLGSFQKAFIPRNSEKMTFSSLSDLYYGGQGSGCTVVTTQSKTQMDDYARLVQGSEISKPTYTAPLAIISK